jgi:hypothetical protein
MNFQNKNDKSTTNPSNDSVSKFFQSTGIQPKLKIGTPNDSYEKEADQQADQVMEMSSTSSEKQFIQSSISSKFQKSKSFFLPSFGQVDIANDIKRDSLQKKKRNNNLNTTKYVDPELAENIHLVGGGLPLDLGPKQFMEKRFGQDFSQVRIHTDTKAEKSAASLNARAYTIGKNIVFGNGEYQPHTKSGLRLLAHELAHVNQQNADSWIRRIETQEVEPTTSSTSTMTSTSTTTTPASRNDVVYIMGNDNFYRAATRFFRARIPSATFVTNIRNLHDMLEHLNNTFNDPLGTIFIVSHANEDGTLSFGLNRADRDNRLGVVELRNALRPSSGSSSLHQVNHLVDEHTLIKIKGCDLGRNQEVVELFDEAFGGHGVVTAPTHEQGYSYNTREIIDATEQAMSEHMQEFEQTLPEIPPLPERVDRRLSGEERIEALRAYRATVMERTSAQRERRIAIAAERRRFRPEAVQIGEIAGTHEFLSGPMFQRPGTILFNEGDIRPEVDQLYPHLSDTQREDLVTRLIRPDSRSSDLAHRQGVYRQSGQRAYVFRSSRTYIVPQNLEQAQRAFSRDFRRNNFTPSNLSIRLESSGETTIHHYEISGHDSRRGRSDQQMTFTISSPPVDSDQTLIDEMRSLVNNPDKFAWRVEENQAANGTLTKTVIWERVVAYLHHGSLDASRGDRFTMPESDRRFFAESTFESSNP